MMPQQIEVEISHSQLDSFPIIQLTYRILILLLERMQSIFTSILVILLFASAVAFHSSGMRSFSSPILSINKRTPMELQMGNNAAFGIFSPVVYAGKFVLGDAKLNKLRAKAISLHSQAITQWCLQYGAYNMRLKLIKKAKKNGDRLGFLV
mmetsp:Transcript_7378/g.12255  ORF Transcript_7378/g.12255 Transcript_7378/m.12255 type:complete len:151 (+) Transcript_7378:90-542(+)